METPATELLEHTTKVREELLAAMAHVGAAVRAGKISIDSLTTVYSRPERNVVDGAEFYTVSVTKDGGVQLEIAYYNGDEVHEGTWLKTTGPYIPPNPEDLLLRQDKERLEYENVLSGLAKILLKGLAKNLEN